MDRKPSKGIATVAEGSIFFLLPQLEVGALTASLLKAFVGLLLIWLLPYMVSRTFNIFQIRSAWRYKPYSFQTDMDIKTVHDESIANRVKHAVPCYHVGGTLLAVGTTCWYTHRRFGG